MIIENMYPGQMLYDLDDFEQVMVIAIGEKTVICRHKGQELMYMPDQLSDTVHYPEFVVNVYRPDLFFGTRPAGRIYSTEAAADRDEDKKAMMGRLFLTKSGLSFLVPK